MALDRSAVNLDGKVAVVTGAAVGIGRSIAETLANFGADVAICDRDETNLADAASTLRSRGRRVVTALIDVRDTDAVRGHIDDVVRTLGPIDVLVNNAGGGFFASFLDVNDKGQAALINENFTSVTNFIRAAVPHMNDGGSIINVTSIEAHRAGPGYAVYSAMKAGVTSLAQSLALELGDRAIRVNTIAPDLIETPGVGAVGGANGLHRPGTPDDCAGAVVFLASGLSKFVTGSVVHVDGGTWAAGTWRRVGR